MLEAHYILTAIFVVLVAFVIILLLGSSEETIKIVGMVLQLLGILTVIYGIEETRKLFGHPSTVASSWQWLKRFPPFGGRTIYTTAKFSGSSSLSARGRVSTKVDPNTSVESRIEALENDIERLHERISMTENEIDSKFRKHKQDLEGERSTRESEDQKILTKLEATEMGGVHISAMGAVWLFVGVILSSIPKELSNWFG